MLTIEKWEKKPSLPHSGHLLFFLDRHEKWAGSGPFRALFCLVSIWCEERNIRLLKGGQWVVPLGFWLQHDRTTLSAAVKQNPFISVATSLIS